MRGETSQPSQMTCGCTSTSLASCPCASEACSCLKSSTAFWASSRTRARMEETESSESSAKAATNCGIAEGTLSALRSPSLRDRRRSMRTKSAGCCDSSTMRKQPAANFGIRRRASVPSESLLSSCRSACSLVVPWLCTAGAWLSLCCCICCWCCCRCCSWCCRCCCWCCRCCSCCCKPCPCCGMLCPCCGRCCWRSSWCFCSCSAVAP
mmetsp:Transcript_33378/g.53809  ORF Transcript_33378/g.53809 Transcript_33378/m.53809 type:complete len:209 (-) Transcript_33378:476-1102(-)